MAMSLHHRIVSCGLMTRKYVGLVTTFYAAIRLTFDHLIWKLAHWSLLPWRKFTWALFFTFFCFWVKSPCRIAEDGRTRTI